MKVSIRERSAMFNLDPTLMEAYLMSREWRSISSNVDAGSIWLTRSGDETVEVLVPRSREARDFPLRISEALRAMAELEKRSEFEVYQDIRFAAYDMVVVSITQPQDRTDLDLSHAVALVINASDMMLATACSQVSPRPAFLWRRPRRAKDYADTLRGLQVSLDRPTVTILSPIPRPYQRPLLRGPNSDPFGRRVIAKLANAFAATQALMRNVRAIDREVVDSLIEHGVSANLYDAIIGMVSASNGIAKVRVDIRFAPVRPERNPPVFEASRQEIQVLQSLSSTLRRQAEGSGDDRIVVSGSTVGLRRPTNSRRGQITIEEQLLFGATRRVRVELEEPDYQLAARAHITRSRVRVSGILRRRGRFWLLIQPQSFSVLSG